MTESQTGSAAFSPCGRYRYRLTREWDAAKGKLRWIMLNPSTADATANDPTIRRCIGFAQRDGYGGLEVYNLFALRSPSPLALSAAADPVGPDNDSWLRIATQGSSPVVLAWGSGAERFKHRIDDVYSLLGGCEAICLGTTSAGYPRHPLYIGGAVPFVPFCARGGRMGGQA